MRRFVRRWTVTVQPLANGHPVSLDDVRTVVCYGRTSKAVREQVRSALPRHHILSCERAGAYDRRQNVVVSEDRVVVWDGRSHAG